MIITKLAIIITIYYYKYKYPQIRKPDLYALLLLTSLRAHEMKHILHEEFFNISTMLLS